MWLRRKSHVCQRRISGRSTGERAEWRKKHEADRRKAVDRLDAMAGLAALASVEESVATQLNREKPLVSAPSMTSRIRSSPIGQERTMAEPDPYSRRIVAGWGQVRFSSNDIV